MSYYPLLQAPGCGGYTTLHNFAPNNWEEKKRRERFLNLTWSDGKKWQSRRLGVMQYGESRTVLAEDLMEIAPEIRARNLLPLLSLSDADLPLEMEKLPNTGITHTSYPNWRSTLGLFADCGARTCYQGELDPFPVHGSMLSFGHFLQAGVGVENYLLFVNLEVSACIRHVTLEVRDAADPVRLLTSTQVRNNQVNIVRLDWPNMDEFQLPMLVCLGMSGIPLYFSRSSDGHHLSLEHTHPPASSVVHGRRWEAQKLLKQLWFSKVGGV